MWHKAMDLCQKTAKYSLQVGSTLLPQMKEFRHLRALLTSEGIDRWIGAAQQ